MIAIDVSVFFIVNGASEMAMVHFVEWSPSPGGREGLVEQKMLLSFGCDNWQPEKEGRCSFAVAVPVRLATSALDISTYRSTPQLLGMLLGCTIPLVSEQL